MTAIVERKPGRVTVSMSPARWDRILQLEKADRQSRNASRSRYSHASLCGIFRTEATETELVEAYLGEKYRL